MHVKADVSNAEKMLLEAKMLEYFPGAYVCEEAFTYFFVPAMPDEVSGIQDRLDKVLREWTEEKKENVFSA